uniref:Uncharacterized protein n=1 Tax=Ananas comosus var. bracteatus TaxID=296719 RepID=A0A6V7PU24_ANACO|nr:unnamed protein product [Ananas comosus var. bracteatus]
MGSSSPSPNKDVLDLIARLMGSSKINHPLISKEVFQRLLANTFSEEWIFNGIRLQKCFFFQSNKSSSATKKTSAKHVTKKASAKASDSDCARTLRKAFRFGHRASSQTRGVPD